MRKINIPKTTIRNCEEGYEGEAIEKKVCRIIENNEPISDGAPLIYTEKKDGVLQGYNIRADKWDIANDAMNAVNKTKIAKSNGYFEKQEETKLDENKDNNG